MGDLPDGWDMKDFKTIEIPPEHKVSLGDTFKYLEDFAKKEEELEKLEEEIEKVKKYIDSEYFKDDTRIEERQLYELVTRRNKLKESMGIETPPQYVYDKDYAERLRKEFEKEYRASGMGIDFNKERTDEEEDERMQMLAEEMLKPKSHTESPSNDVAGVYLPSAYGADIEAEQVFQQELHGIVDEMKVKLVNEKKILEGTLNPEYGKGDWGLPVIEKTMERIKTKHEEWLEKQNELSQSNPLQEQWKSDSPNGSWITDLTPTSTCASSISFSTVEDSSPSFPTILLRRQSTSSPDGSWTVKLVASGTEIVVMNESLDSMEQTINVPMVGMLNEVK